MGDKKVTNIIEFKNVGKKYDQKMVIENLDLAIKTGEIFVLVGPSGSGKTSTLKMINGLSVPTEGNVYFKGTRIKDYNLQKMRWQMGYVLQQIALFPTMTVKQNIEVIPEMLGWKKNKREEAVDRLLTIVGLDPEQYRDRMPKELSGGEQQRIGILRAIAASPEVILMDEPFSALDPLSRTSLQDLVLELHQQLGTTIVFVTHNMEEAIKLGSRIGVMKDGKLLQADTPEKVLTAPKSEFIKRFFEETSKKEPLIEEMILNGFYTKDTDETSRPEITIGAVLSDLYSLLAEAPEVKVLKNQEVIGKISRQDVFAFFSNKEEKE
ncbi:choline ABC transporter, ATP-binding protein OpuBA family protein [Enterococcus faecalis 13-SD-W-01]|nr:choline ABC transporter, ATP-binding protein OpuBA family protein [Enterococcus faecalis 13-SD-W-01]